MISESADEIVYTNFSHSVIFNFELPKPTSFEDRHYYDADLAFDTLSSLKTLNGIYWEEATLYTTLTRKQGRERQALRSEWNTVGYDGYATLTFDVPEPSAFVIFLIACVGVFVRNANRTKALKK